MALEKRLRGIIGTTLIAASSVGMACGLWGEARAMYYEPKPIYQASVSDGLPIAKYEDYYGSNCDQRLYLMVLSLGSFLAGFRVCPRAGLIKIGSPDNWSNHNT